MTEIKMKKEESTRVNKFRSKKFEDKYLVTLENGSWTFLEEKDYENLKNGKIENLNEIILKNKQILLDKFNVNNYISENREKLRYLFNGTSLHIIIPTLNCTQNCKYCHSNSSKNKKWENMDEKTGKKIIDFILQTKSNTITLEFQGGEPLLNFEVITKMFEYAIMKNAEERLNKHITCSIVSNLINITDKQIEYIKNNNIMLVTSLDGPKNVHDKNRSNYNIVIENIRKVQKKDMKIHALTQITKHSLKYPKEIVEEFVNLDLEEIYLKPVNPIGKALKNWEDIGIKAQDYLEFWKKALDIIVKKNADKKIIEVSTQILLKKILTKKMYDFVDLMSPCGACINQLVYMSNGDIYTCDESKIFEEFKLGNVDFIKYKQIFEHKTCKKLLSSSLLDNYTQCEMCVYKPYCGVCPIISYSTNNSLDTIFPNDRCEIFKGMFTHIFKKLAEDEEYRQVFLSWV